MSFSKTFFSEKIRDLQKSDDDGQLNVFVFLAFDAVLLAEKKKVEILAGATTSGLWLVRVRIPMGA